MSVLTVKPEFLYPHSRQFPFDEVAEKIVRVLEKRNWTVPGITVKFYSYGSGEAKFQMVRTIVGENFKLSFHRVQGKASKYWNDVAALEKVCIPKQELDVWEDESGPTYYLYVGSNWKEDKDWFMNDFKCNAKLSKEPRRYLKYENKYYCRRPKELVANDDLGREYMPCGNEPKKINLARKFNQFIKWLEKNVLDYILSFEEAEEILPPIPQEELIEYKGPWERVYSICDYDASQRIEAGKNNSIYLAPDDMHAYFGGTRLVSLGVSCNGRFPEIAYDGFIWCDVNQATKESEFISEVSSAMRSISYGDKIVAIKPKYANGIYVVDNSKYVKMRERLFEKIAPRTRLNDEEYGDVLAARAATIVPINEYKGNYKQPLVLIGRELDFDEIDYMVDCKK